MRRKIFVLCQIMDAAAKVSGLQLQFDQHQRQPEIVGGFDLHWGTHQVDALWIGAGHVRCRSFFRLRVLVVFFAIV